MRSLPSRLALAAPLLALLTTVPCARAQALRLISADDRGVTLRLDLPAWSPVPAGDGRVEPKVPGMAVTAEPGRPLLPYAQALVALPPGAGAVARVLEGGAEDERADLRIAIAGRPVMRDFKDGLGPTPGIEPVPPILDGAWPREPVAVGEPFTLRRQRVVAVQVRPFRWDEASGRLSARRSITVRVDFTGAAAAPAGPAAADSHWEPVFRNALVNYEQGRRWRLPRAAAPAPGRIAPARAAAGAAFDEGEPEVRVRVDTTGVYALPYDDLAAHGYPSGVPVNQVSLHRHEYVGTQDPSYVTIELPVEVADANANGVFDSGDEILAFVQDWAQRSGVTSTIQRSWGDAEVVYATVLPSGGRRIPARAAWRNAVSPAMPTSYPWTQRWERTFLYFAFTSPQDTATADPFLWNSYQLYYYRPDSLHFEVNDVDTSRAAVFRTRLYGKDDAAHVLFGRIRTPAGRATMVVDSMVWYGKAEVTAVATIPGGALANGGGNSLALWGKGTTLPPDPASGAMITNTGLDWFEATYWRAYRALAGYLDASSGDAAGAFQVHATGFGGSGVRVYDVTDPAGPERLTTGLVIGGGAGAWTVDFQDSTAGAPRRYVAFDRAKTLPASSYEAVTRRNLTATVGERDYVLIVPEAFLPAVAPLVALRESQGLGVVVAPLESVNDEFNGGRPSRYAIKRFVRYAYERWNARFVLLAGDGSTDGRQLLNGSRPDWIPVPLVPGPVNSGTAYGLENIAADPWYGWCLEDDPACTSALTIEPDLYVGRLPVNSLAETQAVVAKIVGYESFQSDDLWRRRLLLLADDCYSGAVNIGTGTGGYCWKAGEMVFRGLSQTCADMVRDQSGLALASPEVMDLRSYLTEPDLYIVNGLLDTCRVSTQRAEAILRGGLFHPALFQRLNDGVLWWNWQGHANQTVLAHEGFYRSAGSMQDRDYFMNDGRPFLFTAFSCHANVFSDVSEGDPGLGPGVGEGMVVMPARGAVASWASTGFELVPGSLNYHLNTEFARALFVDPPVDDELARGVAERGARVPLGECIALSLMRYLPTVVGSPQERGVGLTYNLLGDPATRMWIGPAQITVQANGQPVTSGVPVRLATAGDSLRIEADLASNVAIDTIVVLHATGSGIAVVPPSEYALSPAFPDTTPGGAGGRRYHLSLGTVLSSGNETWTLRLTDRYGVTASFDVVFQFNTQLFAGGAPLREGDLVAPDAPLTLLLLSPYAVVGDSLALEVDGAPQPFTFTAARGDTTGRQYLLSWTHAPYAAGTHVVRLRAPGGVVREHRFRVESRFALREAFAFPNPFDDELGTRFLFTLTGVAPCDVLVRVYTASGRRVYENRVAGLSPGHHEIPWDGRDAEGDKLANGVYFYTLVAHGPSGSSSYDGRLVKLRRPRRTPDPTDTGGSP